MKYEGRYQESGPICRLIIDADNPLDAMIQLGRMQSGARWDNSLIIRLPDGKLSTKVPAGETLRKSGQFMRELQRSWKFPVAVAALPQPKRSMLSRVLAWIGWKRLDTK